MAQAFPRARPLFALCLCLSLLAHLLALSLLPNSAPPLPTAPPSVQLTLFRTPVVHPPSPKRGGRGRIRTQSPAADVVEPPAVVESPSLAPRRLTQATLRFAPADLPALSLPADTQPQPQTLADSIAEHSAQTQAALGGRGTLPDIKHALEETIVPAAAQSRLLSYLRQTANEALATTKPTPVDDLPNSMAPGQRGSVHVAPGQAGDVWSRAGSKLCIGACGQAHEVGRLETLIEVTHDERGAPLTWRVLIPSENLPFDQHVLTQLGFLAKRSFSTPSNDRIPSVSTWTIRAVQYHWSIAERILDPAFKPYWLLTECVLASVTYR